ncbi:hypothetical protein U1Q18_013393 [Sarracenia purpurea var. burkii]
MKVDDDFGPDRGIEFETDDEENQAETLCDDDDDDSESGDTFTVPSRSGSTYNNIDTPTWPQSYRESMDMYMGVTPPSVNFLAGTSLTRISAPFLGSSPYRRPWASVPDYSLDYPLISTAKLDKEEVPTSFLPTKLSATPQQSKFSSNELPPPQQKCSYAQSVLNVINAMCGIGLLSTPYALKVGGWWSLVILFILGIVTCYTGILLKRCLESSPGLETYPDIGQAAFGIPGRVFLASSCVEYLIMVSDNLSALLPNAHMSLAGIHLNSYQFCMIISTLVILPTVWLRNLSLLSYISVGGVFTSVLVSLCLLWVGVVDQVGFYPSGTALDLAKLPVTIGLFGFCYGSHSVFPNIYSSMKEPSRFPSVLILSFVTSCLLYAAVAIWGFMMFGPSTKSQFTLNMPKKFVASKVAAWTTVVAPVTKYGLTITPVAFSLEELLPPTWFRSHGVSILIRTILVFSTLVVALTVPYFGSVMAFIGSLLVMLVVSLCIFIMNVGFICAILGTYSAITSIADERA